MQSNITGVRLEDKLKLLVRENDLLNNIIQSASDSIFAKDLEGRYITINRAGAEILGKSIDEVIGKTDAELMDEEAQVVMSWDRKLFETGTPVEYESHRTSGKTPSYYWTSKSPLKNSTGEMIGLIGVSRDITETKTAEDKYRFIFDHAPIAFWEEDFSEVKVYLDQLKSNGVSDLKYYFETHPEEVDRCFKTVRILNVNKATIEMNGAKTKEELIPHLNQNLTPESDGLFIDELVALGNGETEFQKECSFVNRNGEILDVFFNLSVLPGHEDSLSLVLVSIVDVSDMKKMAHELTSIKHRYQSIVEAQTEMICRLNPKGQVIFQNVAFSRFFEFKQQQDDARFVSLFPPDELVSCERKLESLSAVEPTSSCELKNYDRDGNLVWQEWSVTAFYGASGVLLGYQAVGTDVTERKSAQEALAASEARWRSVFNHADDLIITFNTSGYILSINDFKGLPKNAKWAGLRIEEVLRADNATKVKQLLDKVVRRGKPLKTEVDITSQSGGKTTFGVALSPISYGQRVISVVCIARDITETKRLEIQAKEALIEGQEQERMRVSQELHDGLGQLFTAIKFNIQQIRSNLPSNANESLNESIDMLEDSIGMAFMEVKNISRNLMPDVLWQFGIKPAVEDLIEKLNSSSEITLSLEFVDMDRRFSKDLEQAMFRICQELVNNSLRHANCTNVYVQFINHGTSLVLMVEDDGAGYDMRTVSYGFGLKNIRSRMQLFDGSVEVDSGLNKGTVTTIEIPLPEVKHDTSSDN
jgi:PAS domain S-box-containing protein